MVKVVTQFSSCSKWWVGGSLLEDGIRYGKEGTSTVITWSPKGTTTDPPQAWESVAPISRFWPPTTYPRITDCIQSARRLNHEEGLTPVLDYETELIDLDASGRKITDAETNENMLAHLDFFCRVTDGHVAPTHPGSSSDTGLHDRMPERDDEQEDDWDKCE